MAERPAALGRAAPQGPHRARRRRRPRRVRPGRDVRRRPAPGCTTATRSRRTRAGRWPAWCAAPGCAAGRSPATDPGERCSPGERHDPELRCQTDFTALPDLASRALGGGVVVSANDELFAERGEPDQARARRATRPTPSATRARSTTAGRPGAAASPATTRRSSGSARPASCAASSSTPRSSPATTRPRLGRGRRGRGLPDRRRAAEAEWMPLVPRVARCKGDAAQPLRRRRDRSGSPTSGCTSTPTAGWPGCGCTARCVARPAAARRRRLRPGRAGERRRGRPAAATCSTARPAT